MRAYLNYTICAMFVLHELLIAVYKLHTFDKFDKHLSFYVVDSIYQPTCQIHKYKLNHILSSFYVKK